MLRADGVPAGLNQLVLTYPTVPRKLMSVRKVYGVVDSWASFTGFSGVARLYTAKVGACCRVPRCPPESAPMYWC